MSSISQDNIKILLADDHNIVRQGMSFIVEDILENAEIHHSSTIQQIKNITANTSFDFAILDAQFPDGNSLSVISEIKKIQPNIKIMVFTSFEEEKYSLKFINEGADGFLSKLSEEHEIQNAIRELVEKGKSFPPFTRKLLESSFNNFDFLNPLNKLSERELQIALLYAKGEGNLEIANTLSLKQNTVSTFKKRIFEKLNIDSFVELIDLVKTHHPQ